MDREIDERKGRPFRSSISIKFYSEPEKTWCLNYTYIYKSSFRKWEKNLFLSIWQILWSSDFLNKTSCELSKFLQLYFSIFSSLCFYLQYCSRFWNRSFSPSKLWSGLLRIEEKPKLFVGYVCPKCDEIKIFLAR